jgi:hypothetical protein
MPVANYDLVSTKDVSFGSTKRLQLKVSLPEHYDRETVEGIARSLVDQVTKTQDVNAIAIFFYGPGISTAGVSDVATIEWAPKGQWANADSVKTGEYGSFRYSVVYNPPAPPAIQTTGLTVSNKTGLLGVRLPEGAKLITKTRGDLDRGRDPSEEYSVPATAAEILEFFNRTLVGDQWRKDASSFGNAHFFRRGVSMIGVLTNRDGKRFTLMGS